MSCTTVTVGIHATFYKCRRKTKSTTRAIILDHDPGMALLSVAFLYSLVCGYLPCEHLRQPLPGSYISEDHYETRGRERILRDAHPVVETSYGAVRGYSMASMQGNQIFAFEGIRFGEPTGGNNRFKSPVPSKRWRGVRDAFKVGPRCLQVHPLFAFRVTGSEDCLFLNVYSTNLQGEGPEYGPAYLLDRDVILVTFNYRLGVLGFMSTGDKHSTGNYGLKDQALALKWVNENIIYFGGDPKKVTIMGQSAGAASVHLHLLSRKTREYFRSAIALSASAFQHWGLTTTEYGKDLTTRLARIVRCPTHSSQVIVKCFRNMDPNFLVGYQLHLFRYLVTPPVLFGPVIEPKAPDAFISDSAEALYQRGDVAKYPLINTLIEEEGAVVVYVARAFLQLPNFRRNTDKYLPVALSYDWLVENPSEKAEITKKIRNFYFGANSPEKVHHSAISKIFSDRYFMNGIIKSIKSHAEVAATYSYIFRYRGRFEVFPSLLGIDYGAAHQDDVGFFFNSTRYFMGLQRNDEEYKISQILVNFISNFAAKGEPFYTNQFGHDFKVWDPIEPGKEITFLQIDKDIKMVGNPFVNRTAFWDTLGLPDTTPFKPVKRKKVQN